MMAAAPTAPSSFPRLYITSSKPGSVGIISRKQSVVFCSVSKEDGIRSISTKRRQALLQMAFSAVFPAVSLPSFAVDEFRVYSDDVNKFKISIPQDWQVGEGESDGFKSITAFYPEEASSASNVSVAITGIGPDFTRLESFGKVDAFAESLVNGLDRSWQRPPGIAAKLIDCKAANGLYYIEYTLQQPGESLRHIYSAIGMANNGWYNRLYTVTGQFVEDESDKFEFKIEKAVQSFRLG
ncbi:psbP domain-containing protein 3, chloroplastic [Amaranthus tricolor]|uniref:psbP domain-containing protein 3, chloroplastic n=1 Tax=Amaranthus tricolor TaxID=29722 RepID=UPI00258296BC|nr:psbP domain-containing protein 3, chloroplastic [Amaranthus tricolor]